MRRFSIHNAAAGYWCGLACIVLLPAVPEAYVTMAGTTDLKSLAAPLYYELIFGFVCVLPAILLPRILARLWGLAVAVIMCAATMIVGFQAYSVRARWDSIAHAALMQTTVGEATGFVRAFASPGNLLVESAIVAGFALGLWLFARGAAPSIRFRLWMVAAGLTLSSAGLYNFIRYGRHVAKPVLLQDGTILKIATIGVNLRHPVLELALTQFNFSQTHAHYLQRFRSAATDPEVQTKPSLVPDATIPRFVVIVIGESASRRHWAMYGYHRDTTPKLDAMRDQLILFRDVISPSVGTATVLRKMFSTASRDVPFFPVLDHAGYKTHWLSAQYSQGENDIDIAALVSSCDDRRFLNGSYDGNLLPWIDSVLAEPGNHVVFVNLFGSHVWYGDRYPSSAAVFSGSTDKDRIVSAYDNSIRYTDSVLAEMIGRLRKLNQASCLLYVSDHAEDVYDTSATRYLFRNDAIATNAMYEVPFFVWLSPEYSRGNPALARSIQEASTKPYQTTGLYEQVMDLARVRSPIYHPTEALFSPEYQPKVRKVGVSSRTYHPDSGSMMPPAAKATGSP